MSQLGKFYKETVVKQLMENPGYANPMAVPRLVKITLNMGLGESARDKNNLKTAQEEMALISGQRPVTTTARKAIAGFKIREGWPIGYMVTLRRNMMYSFFERLVNIAIPRIRDFRGFGSKSFDGRGNFNMGIKEQIIFPEIDFDKISRISGLDVAITTSANTDEEAKHLLSAFNFPFKD